MFAAFGGPSVRRASGELRTDGRHRDDSDHVLSALHGSDRVARNACSACPDEFSAPTGSLSIETLAELIARADHAGVPAALPINSGPQMHYVLQRAFDALNQWTRDDTPPPSAPRLEVDKNSTLVVDRIGIARGGVRTPWVDAPTNILSGLGQPGDMTELFGTTRPLDNQTLTTRYPHGRDDYLRQFRDATNAAINAGFLLEADAAEIETLGALSWPNT